MKINVTTSIHLDTRREKTGGYYPLKLRITYQRQRKYYPLSKIAINSRLQHIPEFTYLGSGDYSIDKDSFKKATTAKPRGKYAELAKVFNQITNEADEIIKAMDHFSFDLFSEVYGQERYNDGNDVFTVFDDYIRKLKDENRIGTAISYQTSLNSLKKFHKKHYLPFEAITIDFLKKYESWMVEDQGNGLTSVGIYLRQLRAIFNQRPPQLNNIPYPFGRGKYEIPKPTGRNIALSSTDLEKIFLCNPKNKADRYYLDIWKVLYLMNGINVTDLASLKYRNIDNGFIYFVRQKTSKTNRKINEIKIPVTGKIQEIIDAWGNKTEQDNFIFPILRKGISSLKARYVIQHFTKTMNDSVSKTANDLGISVKVTTYFARHSFATQLMRHGAPTEFISKQLGHSSLNTTRSYLHSFEDKQLQEWQSKLTDF